MRLWIDYCRRRLESQKPSTRRCATACLLVENDYDLEVKKETNFKLDGDWSVSVGGKASISADTIVLKAVKSITLIVGNSIIVVQADGIYNEAPIHYEQCGADGQQAAGADVQAPKDPQRADPGTS